MPGRCHTPQPPCPVFRRAPPAAFRPRRRPLLPMAAAARPAHRRLGSEYVAALALAFLLPPPWLLYCGLRPWRAGGGLVGLVGLAASLHQLPDSSCPPSTGQPHTAAASRARRLCPLPCARACAPARWRLAAWRPDAAGADPPNLLWLAGREPAAAPPFKLGGLHAKHSDTGNRAGHNQAELDKAASQPDLGTISDAQDAYCTAGLWAEGGESSLASQVSESRAAQSSRPRGSGQAHRRSPRSMHAARCSAFSPPRGSQSQQP